MASETISHTTSFQVGPARMLLRIAGGGLFWPHGPSTCAAVVKRARVPCMPPTTGLPHFPHLVKPVII